MGEKTTTATGEWVSTPAFRHRWDVFLNFRGEDTRETFTRPLHAELVRNGVRAFIDDEGLTQGDELEPKLPDAIEDSAAAIAIISPSYASSRWCLEELAKILECGRLILPVFYHVNPSDVRWQRGPFKEDFEKLEKSGETQVERWRNAMKRTGGISGWVPKSEYPESGGNNQLIRMLVRRILDELSKTPMNVASYIVGHRYRIEELMTLLRINSNGIRSLGLCGMGGIGKTTLVKFLYNKKLVAHFEHRCFISNVRETYREQPNSLASLQQKLHSDLSLGNEVHEKRVLVVLDDVDDVSQLRELHAWWRKWFGEGSRIIITTRDINVLIACNVDDVYQVKELGPSDSLDLFLYHSLRSKKPTERFLNLSVDIVSLTGGLPLALEVFGSFLFDKRKAEEWEDAFKKLKNIHPKNLQDVLKISYDGLDEEEKCIFLDISCLFVNLGMKRDNVIDILKGCGFKAEKSIKVLISRSLIRIMEDDSLWMHDQIRDMGRQIVQDRERDFGKHSRIWDRGQISNVLQHDKGTGSVEGIIVDFEKKISPIERTAEYISWGRFPGISITTVAIRYLIETYKKFFHIGTELEEEVILETKSFKSMVRLRLLLLSNVRLKGSFECIPRVLKWLQWRGCPLNSLPPNFCPQLTVLDVSNSKIKNVWDEKWWWWWWSNIKVAENLMVMNLYGCYNLTTTPDLSRHPALEKLILERCVALRTIHKSIGDLMKLRHLNLKDCSNLAEFPDYVTGLKSLETLILSGCSKLKTLPQDLRGLNSLKELYVDKMAIEELPNAIFWLTKLELLSLDDCRSLKQLPSCIGKLTALRTLSANGSALEELPESFCELENLETLSLMWCHSLSILPISIGNLKSLARFWISGGSVKELPASIGSLTYLKELSVSKCCNLDKLPNFVGGLGSVIELKLDGLPIKSLPDCFEGLKSLQKLEIRNCKELQSLPESIGCILTLTRLVIENCAIKELPESIGMLEDLSMLRLMMCTQLCKLPSSFGKLKSLHHLYMEKTALTKLPENFGMLSTLITLNMAKKLYDEKTKQTMLPISFSGLSSLQEFDACSWKIIGKIPDDFEKLTSLRTLNLGHNDFDSLPSSLSRLSVLKKLFLEHCENLTALPPLPSSLVELNAANCIALETVSNVSNLDNLRDLNLANCRKLKCFPGLESLSSLRRLLMIGCNSCALVAKDKLKKLALRKLYNLSWPGNKIPDWFTQGEVYFLKPRNIAIKAVIIGVIVSVNDNQIPDNLRGHLPVVPGVQVTILDSNIPKFTTEPHLAGFPSTDEDHFFLCRYEDYHPLVSILKDGDKIKVEMRNPPMVQGVQLKESGIYLVFENDDDYVKDEEFLPENQQSVSHWLTAFRRESSHTLDSTSEI